MGCDIHAILERKNKHDDWELAFERVPDDRWWHDRIISDIFDEHHYLIENLIVLDFDGRSLYDAMEAELSAFSTEEILTQYGNDPRVYWNWNTPDCFDSRNYALFGILAGIRNYDGAPRISDPRGLPRDVSIAVKNDSDTYGIDGHSHSWVTLQELVDFSWDEKLTENGLVEEKHYSPGTRPQQYCRGVGGGETVIVDEADWIKTKKEHGKRYFINSTWEVDLEDHIGKWWINDFKKLLEEFEGEDLNNIRVVFYFDN